MNGSQNEVLRRLEIETPVCACAWSARLIYQHCPRPPPLLPVCLVQLAPTAAQRTTRGGGWWIVSIFAEPTIHKAI